MAGFQSQRLGGGWRVEEVDEGSPKVQTSSYKINSGHVMLKKIFFNNVFCVLANA